MPAFDFRPSSLAPSLVNRALEGEAWATRALAAHAGSVFEIRVGPASATFHLDGSGSFDAAPGDDRRRDLTLKIAPLALPSFLANPKRWDELVRADGDPALAATLKGIAETLPWFVERLFGSLLGPIVGQRVADAGRSLLALPEHALAQVGGNVASYVRYESGLALGSADARSFGETVDELAQRTDALTARIEALEARRAR